MRKTCNKCKDEKEIEYFAKDFSNPDNRRGNCKKCQKEIDANRKEEKKKERELYAIV